MMEEGVAMKSLTVGGTVTRAVIFAVRDSGMRPGLLYAVSVYTVLVNRRTTTKQFGSTSETSPVAPSVRVARSALLVSQESVTAAPGVTWPGEASADWMRNGARTVTERWREASTPSELKARSVNVPESSGTTVTGLSWTMPGIGSMRTGPVAHRADRG